MKYTPKDLGDSAEASSGKTNALDKLKDVVSVVAVIVGIYLLIGLFADVLARFMPDAWEARLGGMYRFEQSDHTRFDELKRIFAKLSSGREMRQLDYQLFVLKEPFVNAFALPGGPVGVTEKLLEKVKSEKSLALVLGHELGHHYHRHIIRGTSRRVLNALLLSIVFGDSAGGRFTGQALELAVSKYSRDQETQADEFGLDLVLDLYGDAEGAFELFDLLVEEGLDTGPWGAMLSTHPYTPERIRHLKARAKSRVGS